MWGVHVVAVRAWRCGRCGGVEVVVVWAAPRCRAGVVCGVQGGCWWLPAGVLCWWWGYAFRAAGFVVTAGFVRDVGVSVVAWLVCVEAGVGMAVWGQNCWW